MTRSLLELVARARKTDIEGEFQRHVSPRVRELVGSSAGGRWGPPRAYSVLYLGRPTASVVVEAYRHLVESVLDGEMPASAVGPRRLLTCRVAVTNVLDLREPSGWESVGLTHEDLVSAVGDYDRCQAVAGAAHQLELHGVISRAATALGQTLSLFERHLPETEVPVLTNEELWDRLPADPRRLHVVDTPSARRRAAVERFRLS